MLERKKILISMNFNKTIVNGRKVGGDYFTLKYSRKGKLFLNDFIDKFNFDDYWCFKSTRKQRLINYEDFLNFEYYRYIFFKKDLYKLERILEWINFFNSLGGVQYLDKPTPPFSPTRIKIKK